MAIKLKNSSDGVMFGSHIEQKNVSVDFDYKTTKEAKKGWKHSTKEVNGRKYHVFEENGLFYKMKICLVVFVKIASFNLAWRSERFKKWAKQKVVSYLPSLPPPAPTPIEEPQQLAAAAATSSPLTIPLRPIENFNGQSCPLISTLQALLACPKFFAELNSMKIAPSAEHAAMSQALRNFKEAYFDSSSADLGQKLKECFSEINTKKDAQSGQLCTKGLPSDRIDQIFEELGYTHESIHSFSWQRTIPRNNPEEDAGIHEEKQRDTRLDLRPFHDDDFFGYGRFKKPGARRFERGKIHKYESSKIEPLRDLLVLNYCLSDEQLQKAMQEPIDFGSGANQGKKIYRLNAIIADASSEGGGPPGGHVYAFVRRGEQWHRVDDGSEPIAVDFTAIQKARGPLKTGLHLCFFERKLDITYQA